jgi:hypothetical protein
MRRAERAADVRDGGKVRAPRTSSAVQTRRKGLALAGRQVHNADMFPTQNPWLHTPRQAPYVLPRTSQPWTDGTRR